MLSVQNMIDCFLALPVNDAVGTIESSVNIIVAIAGGVCAVSGIRFISALKKKRLSATFSFWIQLRVRIEELQRALYADNKLMDCIVMKYVLNGTIGAVLHQMKW